MRIGWSSIVVRAVCIVALAGAAAFAEKPKVDPESMAQALESLTRWLDAPEWDSIDDPSPSVIVTRLQAAGPAVVQEAISSAASTDSKFQPLVAALATAFWDVEPSRCSFEFEHRFRLVEGVCVPIWHRLKRPDATRDEYGTRNVSNASLNGKTFLAKALWINPGKLFPAIDRGVLDDFDDRQHAAFGVALGEACARVETNAAELMRRARVAPCRPTYLFAIAALRRPDGIAFLAKRVTDEAARSGGKAEPDADLRRACHALRRADREQMHSLFVAAPVPSQDAILRALGPDFGIAALLRIYDDSDGGVARSDVVRRAFTAMPIPDAWAPRRGSVEALVRLVALGVKSSDDTVRTRAFDVARRQLGIESESPAFAQNPGDDIDDLWKRLAREFGAPEPPAHSPRRILERKLGAVPTVPRAIESRSAAVASGAIRFLSHTPTLGRPGFRHDDHYTSGVRSAVPPPPGFEHETRDKTYVGDKVLHRLAGHWTPGGLLLKLTNGSDRPVAVCPALLAEGDARLLDVYVPSDAVRPAFRALEINLGWRDAAARGTLPGNHLRTLAPGESFEWTIEIPQDLRSAERIAVSFGSTTPEELESPPATPYLAHWVRAWVK